jgi:hypothetical protein
MSTVVDSADFHDLSSVVGALCLVLDGQIRPALFDQVEGTFGSLPYILHDTDRPDTAHARHLVHRFADGGATNRVVAFVEERARHALQRLGLSAGPLQRAYVNLTLHGDHQYAHVDGDEWTALLFLCREWHTDWGGELLFYPNDGPAGLAVGVEPRPGRLVLFDGQLLHRGGCPTRRCDGPRMTLAVKLAKEAS